MDTLREGSKASALDVAQYILGKTGTITTLKLHKLCYYAQAWSLVWDDEPLFNEPIEAWANGPAIPELHKLHRGIYEVSRVSGGDPDKLNEEQRETVDVVLKAYGNLSADSLVKLTHQEAPWYESRQREGRFEGESSNAAITLDSMAAYYSLQKLDPDEGLEVTPEVEAKLLRALDTPSSELLTSEQMRRRLSG